MYRKIEIRNKIYNTDLKRAIKHAKKSADLTQLSKIYLSECALNISVGERNGCDSYEEISQMQASQTLNAYYAFINLRIEKEDIKLLPPHYQGFASHLASKEYAKAEKALLKIEKTTSLLLCSSLIKNTLETKTKEKILQKASYSGYKKAVLFWLDEILKSTQNPQEIQKIKKKISILTVR